MCSLRKDYLKVIEFDFSLDLLLLGDTNDPTKTERLLITYRTKSSTLQRSEEPEFGRKTGSGLLIKATRTKERAREKKDQKHSS